jgi:hypothetical protein
MRMKWNKLVGWLGVAAIVVVSGCSGSSDEATITVTVDPGGGPGTFVADGDAICDGGIVTVLDFEIGDDVATFRDRYDCSDGSGTFHITGEVELVADSTPYAGTWRVESGAGVDDYQNTEGSGTLAGETEPTWIVEYEGTFGNG